MKQSSIEGERLEPLKITCSSANCKSGLHYFKPTRQMKQRGEAGLCRYCGADLINWNRCQRLDLGDIAYVFKCLKYEMFRHHMWHVEIDQGAINYARRRGTKELRSRTEKRLRECLGQPSPPYDGRQTPREGSKNPIYYGQHATATCCRKCLEYFYGIPQDHRLAEAEIQYFAELIMRYMLERIPCISHDGEGVPAMRKRHRG